MESGSMMLVHSVIIGAVLYVIMRFLLNQESRVAEDRSILLAAVALIYMVLFGHGLPGAINKNIMG
jgi:hypothetical protein